jgi:Fur family peroxide stress response transcriptional regulator
MRHDPSGTEQKLRALGLRPTKARRLILDVLCESSNHLSTEEILDDLRRRGHHASPATLYQNLNRLVQEGLLVRFTGLDGLSRYDANLEPHHHLVCTRCGRIVDVGSDKTQLRRLVPLDLHNARPLPKWRISGALIEFRGVCPICRSGS